MAEGLFYLYLSRLAQTNVPIGERNGVWGLTNDAVQRRLEVAHGMHLDGVEILRSIAVGDHVIAAYGGPQPRVPRGAWRDQHLAGGVVWRVTRPYFTDDGEVWPRSERKPDERWPHRFGIEHVERLSRIDRSTVGIAGMDALHYSANTGGMPVPIEVTPDVVSHIGELEPEETEDPAFLVLDGALSGTALVQTRREQRKLRARLLAGRRNVDCALCEATLPVDCIRTAHIKKRSRCSESEMRQSHNIMRACTLGCDHLFEVGYIYVDAAGRICRSPSAADATPDLIAAIERIVGRRCTAHTPDSEPYFAWHRTNVANL